MLHSLPKVIMYHFEKIWFKNYSPDFILKICRQDIKNLKSV